MSCTRLRKGRQGFARVCTYLCLVGTRLSGPRQTYCTWCHFPLLRRFLRSLPQITSQLTDCLHATSFPCAADGVCLGSASRPGPWASLSNLSAQWKSLLSTQVCTVCAPSQNKPPVPCHCSSGQEWVHCLSAPRHQNDAQRLLQVLLPWGSGPLPRDVRAGPLECQGEEVASRGGPRLPNI